MPLHPRVSVITIFYNAEKFLTEAIESVLAQTYTDWELLLIDDGSTDSGPEIAHSYAKSIPDKIKVLYHPNHENRGKSTSRNLGIHASRGKYLVFLDADDILLPQKLERQVALLSSRPEAGMVYGRAEYWYSWTEKPGDKKRDFMSRLGVPTGVLIQPPILAQRFIRDGGVVPCLCSLMVCRTVVTQTGAFDESIQHLYEDQVLLYKICLNYPVLVDDACGERYRQHPQSSSQLAANTGDYHPLRPNPARFSFLNWLKEYQTRENILDGAFEKSLKKEFWPYQNPALYAVVGPILISYTLLLNQAGALKRRLLASSRIHQGD